MLSNHKVINHLENSLKEKNPFLFNLLKNGISQDEIIAKLSEVGLLPNQSLINLFSWRNGIIDTDYTIGELQLFCLGIFEPLEAEIEAYQIMSLDKHLWANGLFPVFMSCGGDYYLINLGNKDFKDGAIYMYSPSLLFVEPEYMVKDLDSLLELIANGYDNETYKFDGELIIDFDREQNAFENAR